MAMIKQQKNIPSISGIDEEQTWKIIGNFFDKHGLVHHQLDSFNDYINNGIQNVINDEAKIEIETSTGKYVISFGSVHVTSPGVIEEDRNLKLIFPAEARDRDLNYDAAICCDITESTYDLEGKCVEKNIHTRVPIGRTPVMVLSDICNLKKLSLADRIKQGECEKDCGGYFVIKGNERVIVAQLRGNYNQVIVLHQKGSDKKTASQGKPVKKKKKFSHIAEIRSMSEQTGHSVSLQVMIGDRSVVFSLPYIKELIPVGIVFKALGFCEDKEIIDFIGIDSPDCGLYMRIILRDSYFIRNKEEALKYIGQYSMHIIPKEKRVDYAWQVVESELFPHLGICTSVKEKALFLGHMVKKLLATKIGLRSPDDRDNLANKRIETCGILCTELFRTLYKKFLSTIKLQMEKKKTRLDALSIISKLNTITTGLKHSFSTGNWGVQKNAYIRTGVSQVMSRMTFGATLSHTRRIVIPIGKEGKNTQIRQIHASQFGYICPHETPEGQPAGIVLNFSLLARVTKKISTSLVKEVIEDSDYIINGNDVKLEAIKSSTYVFLNGILIGMTEDPTSLVTEIQTLRKQRRLDYDVSVTYDMIDDEVRVFSDSGRASRPLFTVGDNGLNITKKNGYKWDKLVRKGLIEYVDCAEIENYVIAMDQKHLNSWKNDYMEIHPSMMLGVMGSIIPFSDHSPSPRNCYQCLESNEPVLMADNSWKNIKDIVKGDKVVTVDPNNYDLSVTTVINHYSKMNTKPIIQITTETGRIIKCTEDHLLLTPEGWKEAKDANMICVMPSYNKGNFQWYEYLKYCEYETSKTVKKDIKEYQEWIKNKIIKKDIMFVNIDKKITQDNTIVCDITVDSNNHSFIAGDSLVVHNCSMGKQALGIFSTSYKIRTDTIAHILNYPQRPIVSTRASEFMGFNDMPSGINAIVAIMSYTGFNQEDSVILNQSSIDRGLFVVTSYRTLYDSEKKCGSYSFETIKVPPQSSVGIKQGAPGYFRRKNGNYSLLDENGVIRVRSEGDKGQSIHVKKGDVIIGKVMTKSSKSGEETYTDCSVIIKNGEEGIIDRVIQTITPQGYKMVKVVIRLERIPEVGDKFASRAAQKGTCGATYRQEDMPFNIDGICPDIIINPHCIPSRMTVNQLLETVLGKACVIKGEYGDSTPFTSSSANGAADRICDLLAKAGMENASKGGKAYERTGWETLYNGMTGEPVKAKVFMGPTYYQRLKHMVADKMHARANGHVTTLTRQPLEGRSRDGGLRFGEMERDCFAEGTPITLMNGSSVTIETMNNLNNEVLGWEEKTNEIIPCIQNEFLYKGKLNCIELTYEDGRTQICTPEHKILTSEQKWVSAKDLSINTSQVTMSITNPIININDDIDMCNNWKLQFGDITLKTNNQTEYMKTLAFARIIGYLITDGAISIRKTGQIVSYIYLGHMIDVMSVIKDLNMFCNITQTKFEHKNLYAIYVPRKFIKNIILLDGILIGKKSTQPATIPSFILENNCPRPVIREFLGGLFGGDGHTTYLLKRKNRLDSITSIGFSQSKSKKYISSLTKMLENIKKLLEKFNINNVTIRKPRKITYSDNENDSYEQLLHIKIMDICKFSNNIGFRYCCHKSVRLNASTTYINFKKFNNINCSSTKFFSKINALELFEKRNYGINRNKMSFPIMYLTVVKIKNVGIKKVYDIQVENTESFLANGIVSHNCMIAHGASRFLKESLFDRSDAYQIIVCNKCGMITSSQEECIACAKDKVTTCNIPYAAKLLTQELMSMGIKVVIKPKE